MCSSSVKKAYDVSHLIIYCAGGFGGEVLDIAKRINKASRHWDEISFVDDMPEKIGTDFNGHKIQSYDWINEPSRKHKVRPIVAAGEPRIRKVIAERLKKDGFTFERIIDPSAIISDLATIEEGVIVTQYCLLNQGATLKFNSCLNSHSIVGHDIWVGEHTVVSSMVNIGGASKIADGCYIGMGAQLKERITVERESIIGMGSVVHYDVPEEVIVLGSPARVVRRNEAKTVFK